MKYFIHLSYKGTNYHGWQRQPKHASVQAELELQLEKMLGQKVNCIGCGRTDSGVHASQFFCHIKMGKAFEFDPVFRLNKMLPDDISIHHIFEVPRNLHAQHDATSRTYKYYFHTEKNALLSELSACYPAADLDIESMKGLVNDLAGRLDFRAFCKQPNLYPDTFCELSAAGFKVHPTEQRFCFQFTADRFLRGMVRILVGQLLEVGYGRLSKANFRTALEKQQTFAHFKMAYPQGLYLAGITYPPTSVGGDIADKEMLDFIGW